MHPVNPFSSSILWFTFLSYSSFINLLTLLCIGFVQQMDRSVEDEFDDTWMFSD